MTRTLALIALGALLGVGGTLSLRPEPEPPEPEIRARRILHRMHRELEIARERQAEYEPGTTHYARLEGRAVLATVLLNRYAPEREAARIRAKIEKLQSGETP